MSVQLFTLTPDQLEALAVLVARHLAATLTAPAGDQAPQLLSAAEVAARLGWSRSTVYDHAEQLGAVRLGTGTRPRMRFPADRVEAYIARAADPQPQPPPAHTRRAQRRPGTTSSGAPLLEIGARAA
jgi:excisionase family DNA binding protein